MLFFTSFIVTVNAASTKGLLAHNTCFQTRTLRLFTHRFSQNRGQGQAQGMISQNLIKVSRRNNLLVFSSLILQVSSRWSFKFRTFIFYFFCPSEQALQSRSSFKDMDARFSPSKHYRNLCFKWEGNLWLGKNNFHLKIKQREVFFRENVSSGGHNSRLSTWTVFSFREMTAKMRHIILRGIHFEGRKHMKNINLFLKF